VLEVRQLTARYGAVIATREVDLTVAPGQVVALIGSNGSGKTTTLRTIMGQHQDATGEVLIDGAPIGPGNAVRASRAGIAIVPQGRRLFPSLTVNEHLDLIASRSRPGAIPLVELQTYFPGLFRRLHVRARALSGGEQQMLAVSRAVLLGPRFILFDEPVEGLAPAIVENVASLIEQLRSRNTGVLVSDQHESRITEPASVKHRIERGTIRKSD
tara:strand:+ start:2323 stop:2964 length:642 start_codon:yes stop_codon:yes gene_type:complete